MHIQRSPQTYAPRAGSALVVRPSLMTGALTVSAGDVRDLIDAAGPLSLRDIAAGLGVPVYRAATIVNWMLEHDCLQQDEWRRHTLRGCADAV